MNITEAKQQEISEAADRAIAWLTSLDVAETKTELQVGDRVRDLTSYSPTLVMVILSITGDEAKIVWQSVHDDKNSPMGWGIYSVKLSDLKFKRHGIAKDEWIESARQAA
jgi:hypothetical protein